MRDLQRDVGKGMKRILVTGATGQIGTELIPVLRKRYGDGNVVAAGHKTKPAQELLESGPYASLDVRDSGAIERLVRQYDIDTYIGIKDSINSLLEERKIQEDLAKQAAKIVKA